MNIRIFIATINLAVGNWPKLLRLISHCIDEAVKNQCSIIAFSELTLGSIDARDLLKGMTNEETCLRLRLIAAYAYQQDPDLIVFIGHPWQGNSMDTTPDYPHLPPTKRDKLWNAYSCLMQGDIAGMSLKQQLDVYTSRLEERDYRSAKKAGVTTIELPKTVYYTHANEEMVLPEKTIPAGNLTFPFKEKNSPTTFHIYPIIGDQALLTTANRQAIHAITHPVYETCIILNPTATPSTNTVASHHEQLIQHTQSLAHTYIRINAVGGMNGGQGDVLACSAGKVIVQKLSAPFTETASMTLDITRDNSSPIIEKPLASKETLTLRSQARWLFDYLTNTNITKVNLVLSMTGDIVSTYHFYLIYFMIKWHLQDLGLDTLLLKLGYKDEKENILKESQRSSLEKAILHRMLTCVFLRHSPENFLTESSLKISVENTGAKFLSRNAQPLIQGMLNILNKNLQQSEFIEDLHELAGTVITLGISNYKNSISIANLTIDDLILHPGFGGKLHRGQLSPSSSLYRSEIAALLRAVLQEQYAIPEKNLLENALSNYHASSKHFNDTYFTVIAHYALHTSPYLYPIEVFLACKKENCFRSISSQKLFELVIDFYQHWAKAQYGIHASPLTFNHNQQAIEHNMGMRIPIFNAFQRAELAQLVIYHYFYNKISETIYNDMHARALVDVEMQKMLLSFQPTDNIEPFLEKLSKITCIDQHHSSPSLKATSLSLNENIPFKITQASCNQTGGDWANNMKNIFYAIDIAVKNNADFLALPELALSGYDCEDTFLWMNNDTIQYLLHKIADYAANQDPNLLISIGHPWKLSQENNPASNPNCKPFNVQSLLGINTTGEARILLMKYKGELYNGERGFEGRQFASELDNDEILSITLPASKGKPSYNVVFGRKIVARIGNPQQGYFDLFQSICEEYWKRSKYDDHSEEYYDKLNIIGEIKKSGYHIGLYITAHASPPSPNKIEKQMYLTRLASLHGGKNMVVIHTDSLGSSGGNYVNMGARYAAQNGELIGDNKGMYSFQPVIDHHQIYQIPRTDLQGPEPHVICSHVFKHHSSLASAINPDAWRQSPFHEIEAAIRNQLLFLYDTMKKARVRCFTQALSGGADSAWNVVKIRLMIELGVKELGVSTFLKSLHYPEKIITKILSLDRASYNTTIQAIMKHMVICYYLATQNNSYDTENAARSLIEGGMDSEGHPYPGIGGTFLKFNIQPLIERFSFILLDLKNNPHERLDELMGLLSQLLRLQPTDSGKAQYTLLEKALRREFGDWYGVVLSPSIPTLGITVENGQARIRQMFTSFMTKIISHHPQVLQGLIPTELMDHLTAGTCLGLANSNENEARRAYTTFAGDLHSGEINFNGHLPKDHQLQQMQYIYETGLSGLSPIKALHFILHQTPSAELQPKDESNKVVQSDEKALGLTFAEATIINHARAEYQDPKKVFLICENSDVFKYQNAATIHDKIYMSYRGFPIALHKLVAAPTMQTYGEYTVSAKSSMQYPLISTNEYYELARFTLYCLDKFVSTQGKDFFTLTGYTLEACSTRIMLHETFSENLFHAMCVTTPHGNRQYKLEALYGKILKGEFHFTDLFKEGIFDIAMTFI